MSFHTHYRFTPTVAWAKSIPLHFEKKVLGRKKIKEDDNNFARAPSSRSKKKDSQSLFLCRNQSSSYITRNIMIQL